MRVLVFSATLAITTCWPAWAAVESLKTDVNPSSQRWGAEVLGAHSFSETAADDTGARESDSSMTPGLVYQVKKRWKLSLRQPFRADNADNQNYIRHDPYLFSSYKSKLDDNRQWLLKSRLYVPGSEKSQRRGTHKLRFDWVYSQKVSSLFNYELLFQHRHFFHDNNVETRVDDKGKVKSKGLRQLQIGTYATGFLSLPQNIVPFSTIGYISDWNNATGKTEGREHRTYIDMGIQYIPAANFEFAVIWGQTHIVHPTTKDYALFKPSETTLAIEFKASTR